jgi:hypothetical protein
MQSYDPASELRGGLEEAYGTVEIRPVHQAPCGVQATGAAANNRDGTGDSHAVDRQEGVESSHVPDPLS